VCDIKDVDTEAGDFATRLREKRVNLSFTPRTKLTYAIYTVDFLCAVTLGKAYDGGGAYLVGLRAMFCSGQ